MVINKWFLFDPENLFLLRLIEQQDQKISVFEFGN